ncbi:MAG: type II toxin-antitoxin system VapC family toxin [candidate division KSB1 bacterium]|nr:type II toxin-antitoxin system VapC family toxin [candidate division KSB1 bacterium]MDZ7368514.1 type II toxin-antitoxin system VapC family toxin [candidate division KSB1 bacterium]MDZ7406258.1 type II toxin-antitoxin system VapC family toxin [candidate division KSB1 bacterium]
MKRVYVDTSVFGGVFDKEFQRASQDFFDQIKNGQFALITSAVVHEEIVPAPQEVKDFFGKMLPHAEVVDITEDALKLRQAYLDAKIVSAKFSNDALHVALATVSDCMIIVSWNFKHIVHYQKIPLYNAVNILHDYNQISIYSPWEVLKYED